MPRATAAMARHGTWLPRVDVGDDNATITHTLQTGHYAKYGKLVFITFSVEFSCSVVGTGTLLVTDLPLPVRQGSSNLDFGINFYEEFRGLLTHWNNLTGTIATANAVVLEATVSAIYQGTSGLIFNSATGLPQTGHTVASSLSTTLPMGIAGSLIYMTP